MPRIRRSRIRTLLALLLLSGLAACNSSDDFDSQNPPEEPLADPDSESPLEPSAVENLAGYWLLPPDVSISASSEEEDINQAALRLMSDGFYHYNTLYVTGRGQANATDIYIEELECFGRFTPDGMSLAESGACWQSYFQGDGLWTDIGNWPPQIAWLEDLGAGQLEFVLMLYEQCHPGYNTYCDLTCHPDYYCEDGELPLSERDFGGFYRDASGIDEPVYDGPYRDDDPATDLSAAAGFWEYKNHEEGQEPFYSLEIAQQSSPSETVEVRGTSLAGCTVEGFLKPINSFDRHARLRFSRNGCDQYGDLEGVVQIVIDPDTEEVSLDVLYVIYDSGFREHGSTLTLTRPE